MTVSLHILQGAGPTTYGVGKEANCLHMEVGVEFFFTRGGGHFTKIILMRATEVRPKSGENK